MAAIDGLPGPCIFGAVGGPPLPQMVPLKLAILIEMMSVKVLWVVGLANNHYYPSIASCMQYLKCKAS